MSDTNNIVEAKVLDNVDDASQVQDEDNPGVEAPKHSDVNEDSPIMPSPQQEEAAIKKKYGGLLPKKNPLISKDHERAFFDSADWALGKQGTQKSKGPLEALRPKLQPTPHQQARARRSAYAPSDEGEADGASAPSEDKDKVDGDNNEGTNSEDRNLPN